MARHSVLAGCAQSASHCVQTAVVRTAKMNRQSGANQDTSCERQWLRYALDMKTRFEVRLEPDIMARLRALSEAHDIRLAELVRVCVRDYLPRLEQGLTDGSARVVPQTRPSADTGQESPLDASTDHASA